MIPIMKWSFGYQLVNNKNVDWTDISIDYKLSENFIREFENEIMKI